MTSSFRLPPLALALASLTPLLAAAQDAAPPKPPAAAASAAARQAAAAAGKPERLDRVEVDGRPSDDSIRRNSTASKLVFSREEIERFGDSTVGEVLKRLPGVTTGGRPGRGGDIRMRGMGSGYTQILVNGERMPPGFSLDQLPPDQVERIEVMRAPTAEFGARAVAGTINVVLREALQKKANDLRMALSSERGALRPNISWTRNDKLDEQGGAYNLSVNASRNERFDDANSSSTTVVRSSGRESVSRYAGHNEASSGAVHMNGRFQWRTGGPGEVFTLMPIVAVNKGRSNNQVTLSQSDCDPLDPLNPPLDPATLIQCLRYDTAGTESENRFSMARLHSSWTPRLSATTKAELRAALGTARGSGHSEREEFVKGAPTRTQDDTTESRDGSWSLAAKLSHQMQNEHSLVGGVEAEGNSRKTSRVSLQDGLPNPGLADFGENLEASTQRMAVYLQDEWSVGKQWSFYAGLRGETIATRSIRASNGDDIRNRSTVWTPLLHGVWKFNETSRDQIRASLTRSYRAPNLQDMAAPLAINSQYPCLTSARPGQSPCGGNEVNAPDRQGNPDLKPELAVGVEVGYESYLSKGGVLSANVFYRRIQDLMRNQTQLEAVPYASVQRWVSRPRNIGDAKTMGIEFDAKLRLDQLGEELPGVNMRANLSVFRSVVDGIPGPDNKLDQQPRGTANIGADYRLRSLPLTLGASWNYTPANEIQQTPLARINTSQKSVVDAFGMWAFNTNVQLRLSATNLTALDYSNGSLTVTDYKTITGQSPGRTFTLWALRLEMKL